MVSTNFNRSSKSRFTNYTFRLWSHMQRRQVCRIVQWTLGAKWGPLLLLEHQSMQLDSCWKLLQERRWSPCVSHLQRHKWVYSEWVEQERQHPALDRGHRQKGAGELEMDWLQSLGFWILGWEATKQSQKRRLPSVQQSLSTQKQRQAEMEWLEMRSQTSVCVQPEAMHR